MTTCHADANVGVFLNMSWWYTIGWLTSKQLPVWHVFDILNTCLCVLTKKIMSHCCLTFFLSLSHLSLSLSHLSLSLYFDSLLSLSLSLLSLSLSLLLALIWIKNETESERMIWPIEMAACRTFIFSIETWFWIIVGRVHCCLVSGFDSVYGIEQVNFLKIYFHARGRLTSPSRPLTASSAVGAGAVVSRYFVYDWLGTWKRHIFQHCSTFVRVVCRRDLNQLL